MSLPIISAESVAGPSVEMILVRRTVPCRMGKTYNRAARWKVFNRGADIHRQIELAFEENGGHILRLISK
jgi:hypothetical protein